MMGTLYKAPSLSYVSRLLILLNCFFILSAQAKSDHHEASPAKVVGAKGGSKAGNDKDIVLRKNTQSTLYLLSGWGKAEDPYIWYTVSAHFSEDQLAPNGKLFNLFSLSGALDCKENHFFFYRTSYMYFDPKTKVLGEVLFNKSKSSVMTINPDTIESSVKSIICN